MKDPVHHRKSVQKEVIRSTRRAAATEVPQSATIETPLNAYPEVKDDRIDNDHRLDHDGKRKIPLHFVRHSTQREHMH